MAEPAGNVKPLIRSTPGLRVEQIEAPAAPGALPLLKLSCAAPRCDDFEVTTRDPSTAKWAAANHVQNHSRHLIESFLPRPAAAE